MSNPHTCRATWLVVVPGQLRSDLPTCPCKDRACAPRVAHKSSGTGYARRRRVRVGGSCAGEEVPALSRLNSNSFGYAAWSWPRALVPHFSVFSFRFSGGQEHLVALVVPCRADR